MSLPEQEARALESAKEFLYALGNGDYKITTITALRDEARRVTKHYPLAASLRWLETHGETPPDRDGFVPGFEAGLAFARREEEHGETFTEREDIDREGEA